MLTHIEISKKNIEHNIKLMRSLVKKEAQLVGVVKANAYGHGVAQVAALTEELVDYFQVDDFLEFQEIVKLTKKPILVLGYVENSALEELIRAGGIVTVYDLDKLRLINEIGKKLKKVVTVHVKVDAYLGRQGLMPSEVKQFISKLQASKFVNVEAIYSHFSNIEDTSDFSHAQKQIDAFEQVKKIFIENGFKNIKTHISASSGIMVYEQAAHKSDLVRLGLAMYGMWPSEELRGRYESAKFSLKPIIRWVSSVAQVKELPSGHSIGYGLTYITSKPMRVAVIPQGYSDGYDRGFSNVGQVLIKGQRCRILGRVAMNMFVADISHLKGVKVEDEVVLLGGQGKQALAAEELGSLIGTINYEITTRIWPKLPRVIK